MYPRTRLGHFASAISLATILLTLPAVAAPKAEPPSGSVRRSVEVRVTNLDVVVTDKHGVRVPGLSAADFEVREDGALRAITNFSEVGAVAPPIAAAGTMPAPPAVSADGTTPAPPPVRPATYLVLFVDSLNISFQTRRQVLDEVRAFLRRSAEAGVPVLVIESGHSPRVLQKFTTDVALLDRAVSEMKRDNASGQRVEASRRAAISSIDQVMRERDPTPGSAAFHANAHAAEAALNLGDSLRSLETTVTQLSALDGRKVLLHVSDGLPLAPGADAHQYLKSFGEEGRGVGPSPMGRLAEFAVRFKKLARTANASRVVLHMLKASGLGDEDFGISADSPNGLRPLLDAVSMRGNLTSMLSYLAEETGGTAILNRNLAGESLREISEELISYYSLGYESPRTDKDSTHTIEVRMKPPGLRARAQRSLTLRSADTRVAEGVSGALMFGRPENPFGFTVEFGEARPTGRQVVLPVRVRVPANRLVLLPGGSGSRGSAVFYFQVRDEEGRVSDVIRQEDVLEREGEVVHHALLQMRRGRQVISIAVRDGSSGIAGYAQKRILIPAAK